MAPRPRAAVAAGVAAVQRQAHPWEVTAPDFFTDAERVRMLVAGLIGAHSDDIALLPSVSYGIGTAASNLPVEDGQRILVLAEQFPSNVYPWRERATSAGGEVVTVPRPSDSDWTAAVLEHLDERVAVVAVPNCHWTDGTAVDLEAVGSRAREVGAALVVDGSQSIGAMPFDVNIVQPDFLVTAAYKWLLGPYSMAFLYAAPGRQAGIPLEHNWITRRGSSDFARLVDYTDDFEPGARRYDVGERSNFTLLPMVIAALELITEWGVDFIAAALRHRTSDLAARAEAAGFEVAADSHRSPHLVGLRSAEGLDPSLAPSLAADSVIVSVRGDSIRVSPHLYNTDDDVDRLFAALGRSPR